MGDRAARWSERLPLIVGTVAVVVLATTTAAVLLPSARDLLGLSFGAQPPAEGDVFVVALPDASKFQRSVVVLGRSTCASCRAAVPFLADLVSELRAESVPVFFVSSEQSIEEEQKFAARIGVEVSRVVLTEARDLRGVTFPSVVIVDAQQVVERHWGTEAITSRSPEMVATFRQLSGALRR